MAEQNLVLWVKRTLQLCVIDVENENDLIKEKFMDIANEYRTFELQEKQKVFELMENALQDSKLIVYVCSCVFFYTKLLELEKPIMKYVLSSDYDVLSGCMVELQIVSGIKGCYKEKRILHRKNADNLRRVIGQEKEYILIASRHTNRIVIMTEQIKTLSHAPTAVIFNMAYIFKKFMKYEVLIYVCPSDYLQFEDKWYNPCFSLSMDDIKGQLFEMKFRDESFELYQVHMASKNFIQEYRMMLTSIQEWNPAFVLGVGVVNPILELVSDFTSVASMNLSINCPVSDSEILFRLARRDEKIEQEYAEALNPDQSQIFMENVLPVNVAGQNGGIYTREELGLPKDKFVIVIVGNRLDKEIGMEFVEFMKSVLNENPDSVFAVVGSVKELKKYFEERKYLDRIFYLGYCSDLLGVYGVMDLYLNPGRAGGGWSSAMALMAGVPVVTLPDCDVAYNVGERFIVFDYVQMKEVVGRYITDRNFFIKMKNYAKESGAENSEDNMRQYVQSMADGISAVLEGKK